jgi:hypothetical protein
MNSLPYLTSDRIHKRGKYLQGYISSLEWDKCLNP